MSSHREAPEISKDPVADSTDLYTFMSPAMPDNVTIIANYVPLRESRRRTELLRVRRRRALRDQHRQQRRRQGRDHLPVHLQDRGDQPEHVPLQHRSDPVAHRQELEPPADVHGRPRRHAERQEADARHGPRVAAVQHRSAVDAELRDAGHGRDPHARRAAARCSPANGPKGSSWTSAPSSTSPSCGRSSRPTRRSVSQNTGLGAMAAGVNSAKGVNVHSIALEVPKTSLTKDGAAPTDAAAAASVIGVWTTASRQKARVLKAGGTDVSSGPYVQVSRLGNPLVNEVVVPMSKKDYWNSQPPVDDKQFTPAVLNPELAQLLPGALPGVFPNLDAYNKGTPKRDDLVAIFHTGLPTGVVPGFQNSMGTTQADMLRLNLAIPPTTQGASNLGLHRQRRRRVPERAARLRRRRDDRAARGRRSDASARRQELHARRRGGRHHRRADRRRDGSHGDGRPRTTCPASRTSARRTAASRPGRAEPWATSTSARRRSDPARRRASWLTSVATSARRCCTCPRRSPGSRSRSARSARAWDGTHTGVRERHVGDIGDLGRVLRIARAPATTRSECRATTSDDLELEVDGGEVTEAPW